MKSFLLAVMLAASFAVSAAGLDGWKVLNLGDGAGKVFDFTAEDGTGSFKGLFVPNARSWLFLVKNLSSAELKGANKLYLTADVMTNHPGQARLVICENAEWGQAQTRWIVRGFDKAFEWQRVTVEFDRADPTSFMSLGLGIEYRAAGTWMAIGNVEVSTAPPAALPPLPTCSLLVPGDLGDGVIPDLAAEREDIASAAELNDVADNDPEWLRDQNTLAGLGAPDSTATMRVLAGVKAKYVEPAYSLQAVPATFEFDHSTRFANRPNPYTMVMPRNAREEMICLLRNNTANPENFVLKFSGPGKMFKLLEVDGVPDYPEPLASGGILHVGANETAGVMIQFKSADAGVFKGTLEVKPFNPQIPAESLPVTLEVVDVVLPEALPISTFHWDYGSANDPEKLAILIDGRVNTFHLSKWTPNVTEDFHTFNSRIFYDFSDFVSAIRAIKKAAPNLDAHYVVEAWFIRNNGGWKKEYEKWLDQLAATLAAEGVDDDHWFLTIYDEDLSDEFYESAKAIKTYRPQTHIFSDKLTDDPAVVKKFAPYVDAWTPPAFQFPPLSEKWKAGIEEIRKLKDSKFYVYSCGPVPANPARTFREQPLLSFAYNLDGCYYWTTAYFIDVRGPKNPDDHFGFFYRDADGKPVLSRRWLAWQDGLNDYLVLSMLPPEKREELRKFFLENLNTPDFWPQFMAKRDALLRGLASK
ncbi:MAG: hypothetical protein AB7F40_00935 [Victivallaceae bacterium]|nr:hypothetical protein [Victivallaceae bacterium]